MKRALMITLLALAFSLPGRAQESGQTTFVSPEEAVKALVTAVRAGDQQAMVTLVGPSARAGLAQQNEGDREALRAALEQNVQLVPTGDALITLMVGKENYPLPLPLVKENDRWFFDGKLGLRELQARRIGRNELGVIRACEAYVQAQRAFAALDADNTGLYQYAQRFVSQSGRHDGLYWPAARGTVPSPLGPFFAEPANQGARAGKPFHGYHFRILTGQGPSAPGGAFSYLLNGHMVAGFGLVAYPAVYGETGIMTFIMGPTGVIYERDLKGRTEEVGRSMTTFNPASGWKRL